jgi:hypothetical protein
LLINNNNNSNIKTNRELTVACIYGHGRH